MHISVTTLKRLCRRHGVKRWPHRQISGINRALSDLEAQHKVAEGGETLTVTEQLRQLHRRREVIIEVRWSFLLSASLSETPDVVLSIAAANIGQLDQWPVYTRGPCCLDPIEVPRYDAIRYE